MLGRQKQTEELNDDGQVGLAGATAQVKDHVVALWFDEAPGSQDNHCAKPHRRPTTLHLPSLVLLILILHLILILSPHAHP